MGTCGHHGFHIHEQVGDFGRCFWEDAETGHEAGMSGYRLVNSDILGHSHMNFRFE